MKKHQTTTEETMIETYVEQKKRHAEELNNFKGLFFAFSQEQLNEGLKKLNATTQDIVSIGAGGFILKAELQAFKDMYKRHGTERRELKNDRNKLFEALVYELRNHEYCVTYDTADALDSLGLTKDDVEPALLKKACNEAVKGCYC